MEEEDKIEEEKVEDPKLKQSKKDHKHNTKYAINTFSGTEKGPICGSSYIIGGPIWNAEIHDIDFVNNLATRVESWEHLGTSKRIKTTLSAIQQEMAIGNYPLSFEFDGVMSEIRSESIPKKCIFAAFGSLGYKLAQTYYNPLLYKTDAPHEAVYDIFKAWKRLKLEGTGRKLTDKGSGNAINILSKPIQYEPDFEYKLAEMINHLKENKVGYNKNPPNWGPGSRPGGKKQKKADMKKEQNDQEELQEDEHQMK